MKSKQSKEQKQRGGIGEVFMVGNDGGSNEVDFESLQYNQFAPYQQQQQVMLIGSEGYNQLHMGIQQVHVGQGRRQQSSDNFIREFEEIRFGSDACNLIDMDMPSQQETKSVLNLSPYEYQKFIEHRVIDIETPQLINQGYILSYKLYQVKTKINQNQQSSQQKGKVSQNRVEESNCFDSENKVQNNQSQKPKQNQSQYDTCVSRRFSDFQYLNELLINNYGGFIIPLLPSKNFWTILNLEGKQFAEYRTKSLTQYLNRLLNHKKLKHSTQLKSFLFQQDTQYSTQKGQYLQKNSHLEDKIISIGTGAFEYGKALYNKFVGGQQKGKEEEEIRLSKSKLTKDDLVMSEYELVVGQLMRIMSDLKALVQNTVEQIRTVDDIEKIFSSPLKDPFTNPTIEPKQHDSAKQQQIDLTTHEIEQQFEQISQFIESCHAAISRRKALRLQIQSLKQQEQALTEKYKNSPRSLQLDIVRSKQNRLNKINQTYAQQLIKQLEFHIDQGKGMLRLFVVKFQKLKKQFFQQSTNFNQ